MNTQDQALLVSRLYLPVVVKDILETDAPLADDMNYSLHEVLSDYRPDSALLAMALSAKIIAENQFIQTPQLRVLAEACGKMSSDYAPRWMETFEDTQASEQVLLDVMEILAEDLQTLSDLIRAASLDIQDEKIQALFKVFEVQAAAQSAIADEFLNVMDCEFMQEGSAVPVSYKDFDDDAYSELDLDIVRYGGDAEVVRFPLGV